MSNLLLNTLSRTDATSAVNRSFGAERAPRDGAVADDEFARALERRRGSNEPERPALPPAPARDEVRRQSAASQPDRNSPATRHVDHTAESNAAASQNDAAARRPDNAGSESAERSDAPKAKAISRSPESAETASVEEAGDGAENAELPADSAQPANLAALLQGVAALPPSTQAAAAPVQDAAGTGAIGQEGGKNILSNVLATLQRDGAAQAGVTSTNTGKGDPAAAGAADNGAFALPTDGAAAPLAAKAIEQTVDLQNKVALPADAELPTTSNAASPDAQTFGLQLANLTSATRSEATHAPQSTVHTPAGQAAWAEDVGNRVVWMAGRNESKADLVLTPAHLGKLEISIQVSGDQTTAQFVAASAAARDALEQALPRLREVLQQAGIHLGQTNVSTSSEQQAQRDNQASQPGGMRGNGREDVHLEDIRPTGATVWSRAALGMVDTFA